MASTYVIYIWVAWYAVDGAYEFCFILLLLLLLVHFGVVRSLLGFGVVVGLVFVGLVLACGGLERSFCAAWSTHLAQGCHVLFPHCLAQSFCHQVSLILISCYFIIFEIPVFFGLLDPHHAYPDMS